MRKLGLTQECKIGVPVIYTALKTKLENQNDDTQKP